MFLVDREPSWVSSANGRFGMGLRFLCPHCDHFLVLWFENPLDKGPSVNPKTHRAPLWRRTGSTFETLSLSPSINARDHWHGVLEKGELYTCT